MSSFCLVVLRQAASTNKMVIFFFCVCGSSVENEKGLEIVCWLDCMLNDLISVIKTRSFLNMLLCACRTMKLRSVVRLFHSEGSSGKLKLNCNIQLGIHF